LWALVNLQIDTWHASAPEFQSANCRTRTATGSDGTLGLSPLESWLEALVNDMHLPSLGETNGLKIPVSKIVKFLQFRQQFAHALDLRALCDDIRAQRLREGPEIPAPLRSLIEAASPTANNEQLYDAAIWLRYIILMSFNRERSVILDDAATNNLKKAWEKFGLGQPFTPVIAPSKARRSSSCAPFLRWNAAPYNGHVSAVLGDLMEATYNYLSTERKIQALEEDRFRTISEFDLKAAGRNYSRKLSEQLNPLDSVFADWVQPYFPPLQNAPAPQAYQPSHWAEPTLLTMPGADWEVAFRSSSTRSEQDRFARDLATLATEIKSTQAKYGLIKQAYEQVDSVNADPQEITNALESLGGLTALSNWNLYRLPFLSFDILKKNLNEAIKELKIEVDAAVLKDQLRSSFKIKRKDVERDYLTLLATRLGKRVAERAIKISQIYEKINELGVQIEDLEAKASRLENEGWKTESERAGAELAYRRRIRDLAAARVEALIEASKEAAELAKTAEEELGAMAEQLQAAARTIEDNRSSSAIFGIVKLVVNVVGAALAPFTGGASIAIATLVNKGLDIYQQIQRMKWGGLTQTIANLEELAPAIADGISFAVDNFGSPKLKEEFAQVSMFLKSTQEKLHNVFEDLKKSGLDIQNNDTVKSIIKAVQDFKKDNDVLNFATAIANGYTVTVADTQIRLDFRGKQVRLTNQRLQQDLLDLFAAGHVIVNDAVARAEGLTNLATLADEDLRQQLHSAFKGAITQLPPDFLARLNIKTDDARKRAAQVLDHMKDTLAKLGSEDRRLFAQLLAAGCLFVNAGGVVVAVEPPPLTEAEKFKDRLDRYQNRIKDEVITNFISDWTKRKEQLTARAQELSANEDENGLRQFANSLHDEITRPGDGLQAKLGEIRTKIDAAKEDLDDKTTEQEIANYEARANELFAQASDVRVQQSDVRGESAELSLKAARELYLNSLTEDEQAGVLVQAELRRIESAELALIQAYEKCLAIGFNPMSLNSDFNNSDTVSLQRVLANFLDLHRPLDYSRVGDSASLVVGMIQWANLLGVRSHDPNMTPAGLYFKLVKALTGAGKGVETLANEFGQIQKEVENGITSLHLDDDIPQLVAKRNIGFDKIYWLDRPEVTDQQIRHEQAPLILAERNSLLAGLGKPANRVIGMLRVLVNVENVVGEDLLPNTIQMPPRSLDLVRKFYVDLDHVFPLAEKADNLSFVVVPPKKPTSYPDVLTIGATNPTPPDDIQFDPDFQKLEDDFQNQLDKLKSLKLTGALGEWTLFILAPGSSENLRLDAVNKLKANGFKIDSLVMGFFQIPISQ